jgi:hypothetical protein
MTATKKLRKHPKPPTRSALARPAGSAQAYWTVYHTDGEELGLLPVKFVNEQMARSHARLWNKQYPGHRVLAIMNTGLIPKLKQAMAEQSCGRNTVETCPLDVPARAYQLHETRV